MVRILCRRGQLRKLSTDSDYSTNGGIVEGVWTFARHGDRTPSRSLCAPQWSDVEAAFWRSKLPTPDPVAALKALSEHFPPDIHPSNDGQFIDVTRRPYGFLTRLGMEQLHTNGRRFFIRYDRHGHHCRTSSGIKADAFLHSWDVQAFSTNYLRTVLSAQCFLDGLLGTGVFTLDESEHIYLVDDESRLVPDHATTLDAEGGTVNIRVRDKLSDNLNAFDRNPQLIKNLVTKVVTTDGFVAKDTEAAPLAARLANYLPGLMRENRQTFGGPSGINWIEATDHFVCRRSHGVKFSRFSEFENDHLVERTLEAMEQNTLAHRAWRFRQWYQDPPLLAEIASPALREILEQMQAALTLGDQERHPFIFYGCHDVTILALLYGIGADFLADETNNRCRYWPGYGTTLVFELVRIGDDTNKVSHVVRVLLNGMPIRSTDLFEYKAGAPVEHIGKGPVALLTVDDFEKLIVNLETVGGMPHEFVPVGDESVSSGRIIKGETG